MSAQIEQSTAWVVAVGNLLCGFEIIGPFDLAKSAREYAVAFVGNDTTVSWIEIAVQSPTPEPADTPTRIW